MKKIRIRLYLAVCILLGLVACSSDNDNLFSNHLGYWELLDEHGNYPSIVKIYENEGSFYADINVLSDKAPDGGIKVPAKLNIRDKELYIDSPFMRGAITYYSDKDNLVIGNENLYMRLTDEQFSITKEQQTQCKIVRESFIKDVKAMPLSYDKNKKVKKLKEKYNKKIEGLEGCRPL